MASKKTPSIALTADKILTKSVNLQYPLAVSNVARLRRLNPDKSPEELIKLLNKIYIGTVAGTGAGAGAAAIVPNGWAQAAVTAADLGTFLEASVLYTLSVAEVHGLSTEDFERRKLLVLAVLVGDSAAKTTLKPLFDKTVPYWGKAIVKGIPKPAIKAANKVLGHNFVTKYGTRQGVLVLGKQIPLAIGVGVGAAGNSFFAWSGIKAARAILGPPPAAWPDACSEVSDSLGVHDDGDDLDQLDAPSA
ncbi:hypothetical protein [Brachybacterium timonense]|uniref:hypothetical protein n=1 Tax=Brachybacterium timonense TaxID=2050896 RepID=UPI000D0AEDE8|nr:hypothetical protein [Brachybacterium timonense]